MLEPLSCVDGAANMILTACNSLANNVNKVSLDNFSLQFESHAFALVGYGGRWA